MRGFREASILLVVYPPRWTAENSIDTSVTVQLTLMKISYMAYTSLMLQVISPSSSLATERIQSSTIPDTTKLQRFSTICSVCIDGPLLSIPTRSHTEVSDLKTFPASCVQIVS